MKPLQRNNLNTGLSLVLAAALALLLGAGVAFGAGEGGVTLPPLPGGPSGKVRDMSLPEAVFLVVRDNTSIQNAYLDRVVQKFNLEVEEHKFKPDVTFDANLVRSGSDYDEDSQWGPYSSDTNQTQAQGTLTINEKIPTGAEFTFTWEFTKTKGDSSDSADSEGDTIANTWSIQDAAALAQRRGA